MIITELQFFCFSSVLSLHPGYDVKLIRCDLSTMLNSSVVVQGMTVKLWPCLCLLDMDEAVSAGKPLQERV